MSGNFEGYFKKCHFNVIMQWLLCGHCLETFEQPFILTPGHTGTYNVLPGHTGPYNVLPGYTGTYNVLPGYTGTYNVFPGHTGTYNVLPESVNQRN